LHWCNFAPRFGVMTRWVRSTAALGMSLVVASMPAGAQTGQAPQEKAAAASPRISVNVGSLEVRDLTFNLPGDSTLSIGRIRFSGLVRNDVRARADRIDIEKVLLAAKLQTVEIPSIVISGADLPALLFRTMTAGEPASDLAAFLASTIVERIDIERIVQRDPSAQFEAVHSGLSIDGVKDGILASIRISRSTATAPGAPGVSEKVHVKSGEVRYQQFNFAEMVRFFTGGGSGGAKRLLQRATVDGFEVTTDQAVFRVKRAEVTDVDGRAPTQPFPMNLKMQPGTVNLDAEQQKRVAAPVSEIIRFARVARYSLEEISVAIPTQGGLFIGAVTLTGFSSRGIERFVISGFDVRRPGARVRFDRFEIEGLKYGALIDAALDAASSGVPPDFSPAHLTQLVPRLAAIRLSRLDAKTPQGPLTLGDLRFEFEELADATNTSSAINGLKIDLGDLDANEGRDRLMAFGYRQIVANAQARVSWERKTKALMVRMVGLSVDNVGRIEVTARLDNVDADKAFANLDSADRIMSEARLGHVEIKITDLGFAERFYADTAKSAGISPDAVRAGLAAEMRSQALNNFGPMLGPGSPNAITAFLQSPGTITARIAPTDGQPPLTIGEIRSLGPLAMQRVIITLQARPK